jgi:hypothetical protein
MKVFFILYDNSDIVLGTTVSSSNELIVRTEGSTIVQFISNANTILGTGWNHISIVYKAGSSDDTIFINGILQSANNSSPFSSSIDLSGKRFDIGRYRDFDSVESYMSSFAIYNVAKSAEEIKAIYNDGIGGDESSNSGLVGYWKLDNATTVTDLSGNGNNGTVNGGATLISAGTTDSVGNNDGGLL